MPRETFEWMQLWSRNIWSYSWFPFHPSMHIHRARYWPMGWFSCIGKSHSSVLSDWRYHPCLKNYFGLITVLTWYCSSCWNYCPLPSKQSS
jgi:hypothetical protein